MHSLLSDILLCTSDTRMVCIQGGFSGWTSSKLKTKMSNSVSAVEILAPVFGTVRRGADQTKVTVQESLLVWVTLQNLASTLSAKVCVQHMQLIPSSYINDQP